MVSDARLCMWFLDKGKLCCGELRFVVTSAPDSMGRVRSVDLHSRK